MKLENASQDFERKFNSVLEKTTIPTHVEFALLSNDKMKEHYKILKANDVTNYLAEVDIVVIINERIFDMLDEELQNMLLDEMLSVVYVNMDNDKITINKFDVNTTKGFLNKYGIEGFERYIGSINAITEQLKEKKKEEETE